MLLTIYATCSRLESTPSPSLFLLFVGICSLTLHLAVVHCVDVSMSVIMSSRVHLSPVAVFLP